MIVCDNFRLVSRASDLGDNFRLVSGAFDLGDNRRAIPQCELSMDEVLRKLHTKG